MIKSLVENNSIKYKDLKYFTTGVDVVREKIKGFASSMGFKKWKIVFLDESDYLTPNAQA